MSKNKISRFVLLFFVFVAVLSFSPKAFASTIITDDVTENTTWTKENSPYLVQNSITVLPGVTLTIEPGVVVKFIQDFSYFGVSVSVLGNIIANGTSLEPIYFTSNYDDTIGGNTDDEEFCYENIDEAGNDLGQVCENFDLGDPLSEDWDGIYFKDSTGSSFKNTFFRYADNTLSFFSSDVNFQNLNISDSREGIALYLGNIILDHIYLNNIDRDALSIYGGAIEIQDSLIENVLYGDALGVYDGSLHASLLTVQNIGFGSALGIYGGSVAVEDSTFKKGLDAGIEVYGGSLYLHDSLLSGYPSGDFASYAGVSTLARLKIENTNYGVSVYGGEITVHNSAFKDISVNAVENYSLSQLDARQNFWGDPSGPYEANQNPLGLGYTIYGNVLFNPWCQDKTCKVAPTRNPVLIIPGVLGTEINKSTASGPEKLWLDLVHNLTDIGDQFMDPLQFNADLTPLDTSLTIGDVIGKILSFDYSDSLMKEFQNQGYTEGTDLFLFPYDWRYGVSENIIDQLKQKIQDIRTQTGSEKIDVVAHSTGGLLVKKYVIENPSNNHIGKAVFVGVPNTGAPKAIKAFVQGDNFGNSLLADSEMKKIAKNLPVAYDLSPSERFFNTKGSYIKIINQDFFTSSSQDLDFNQSNSFLTSDHNLNSQALSNAHNLHTTNFDNFDLRSGGVDLYSINGCKAGTLSKVVERRVKTILGGTLVGYEQPEESPGDGTVPLESSTNLPINEVNKYYALKSEHGKMLSQDGIRQEIVSLISGGSLNVDSSIITQDISKCKLNGKAISVYSPLDIDITDQDGNHSGLVSGAIQNDIPNADFEIMGGHKFVYLPDGEGQIYTINIKGTDTGTFTIKDQDINDNQVTQTQVFSNIPVTSSLEGQVNIGDATTTLFLNNNDQPIQPSSVVDSDQSQDLISPISTPTLTGLVGQPSFYRSNVSMNLSAIDPIIVGQENQTSGILKTVYKLDNDSSYTTYVNPVVISSEGKHTLKFFSTDKAGNNETEQSIEFTIDKNAPEFIIQFNPASKNLQFTGADNISDSSAINVLDQDDVITLTDQSGNITQMKLKDKDRKHQLKAEIKSLIYNNQPADITKNKLSFDWKFDKQQNLKELNQHVKSKKDFNVDASYENGKTTITGKDQTGKIKKLLNGLTLLKISTDKGDLNWSY